MVSDWANIIIAILYDLSIGIFNWYIFIWSLPILQVKSRLCTFLCRISRTLSQTRDTLLLPSCIWSHALTLDWHINIWPWPIQNVKVSVVRFFSCEIFATEMCVTLNLQCIYASRQRKFDLQFSSKSSSFSIFIFRVKYQNRVGLHCKVHTWLSSQTGTDRRTLLLPRNSK